MDTTTLSRVGTPVPVTYAQLTKAAVCGEVVADVPLLTITAHRIGDCDEFSIEHHAETADALSGWRMVVADYNGYCGGIGHTATWHDDRVATLCLKVGRFAADVKAVAALTGAGYERFQLQLLLLAPGEVSRRRPAKRQPTS
jgi:hypothetical protein